MAGEDTVDTASIALLHQLRAGATRPLRPQRRRLLRCPRGPRRRPGADAGQQYCHIFKKKEKKRIVSDAEHWFGL
jgi:hypothetical protein